MKIKAIYKKGRLTYPIELVNVWVDPLNGLRNYKDALTGDWIPQKYIRKPKLIERCNNERRFDMVRPLFDQCYNSPSCIG